MKDFKFPAVQSCPLACPAAADSDQHFQSAKNHLTTVRVSRVVDVLHLTSFRGIVRDSSGSPSSDAIVYEAVTHFSTMVAAMANKVVTEKKNI
jgi:hypothetical protein